MINCSLCGEKSKNVHSVYYEENDKIVAYCEDCEDVYINQLALLYLANGETNEKKHES